MSGHPSCACEFIPFSWIVRVRTNTFVNVVSKTATTLRGHFGSRSFFAQIEKCIQVLMDRSEKRRGAPEPVVEHIAPALTVFQASSPVVEYIAPVPAVFQASPVVEFLPPSPADIPSPALVVECISSVPAVFHAPVFPLSPGASDMSAPEDMYTSLGVVASAHQNLHYQGQCGGRAGHRL